MQPFWPSAPASLNTERVVEPVPPEEKTACPPSKTNLLGAPVAVRAVEVAPTTNRPFEVKENIGSAALMMKSPVDDVAFATPSPPDT